MIPHWLPTRQCWICVHWNMTKMKELPLGVKQSAVVWRVFLTWLSSWKSLMVQEVTNLPPLLPPLLQYLHHPFPFSNDTLWFIRKHSYSYFRKIRQHNRDHEKRVGMIINCEKEQTKKKNHTMVFGYHCLYLEVFFGNSPEPLHISAR